MSQAVITANRLRDGVVVWRATDAAWVEPFGEAAIFAGDVEPALADARADVARQLVVGVYAVPVTLNDGRPVPENVRETIRAHGPSVRRDLGIQARTGGAA